jgi:regulator of protease activity HflC (stomatin/prohibitin superfamily)
MSRDVHDMTEIRMQKSSVADGLGVVCFPGVLALSCWVLDPREEALVLNFGVLTERHNQPGCHISNMCGREILKISTAQVGLNTNILKLTLALLQISGR